MLQRYIDDLKHSTGASLRMTSLVAIAGFAGFIALCFACAAIFIAVLQQHGAIAACLGGRRGQLWEYRHTEIGAVTSLNPATRRAPLNTPSHA